MCVHQRVTFAAKLFNLFAIECFQKSSRDSQDECARVVWAALHAQLGFIVGFIRMHCCAHPAFASATYRRTASRSTCCFQHTRRSGPTTPPRSTRRSPGPCIHTTYTTSVWRVMYGNDVYNQRVALEYGGMGLFVSEGLRGLLPLPAQHNHRRISFVLWKCLIYVDLRHVL